MTLITGLIGITMLVAFLGIMLWWLKELPLTIIVLVSLALLVYVATIITALAQREAEK